MKEFIPLSTRYIDLPTHFYMKRGGELNSARIAYEMFGRLNNKRSNVILILTGLSSSAHVAAHTNDPSPGWWDAMVGSGKYIDTDRWCVICVNSLGSCNGSTGPASVDPSTGEPYRLNFPNLSIEDIADSAAFAVRALGFDRLACVIGPSMGGMSALSLLSRHPDLARNHINISGAVHSLPFSIAIRSLQREAIRFDPNWNRGHYSNESYPKCGVVTARKLGVITYRSAMEWNCRFGRTSLKNTDRHMNESPFSPEFEVEGYLDCHAHRFLFHFDPNCYLYLSRSIDWFDLGESGNSTADQVLSQLRLEKALIIGVPNDILFPVHQQKQIADGLTGSRTETQFLPLDSLEGHDAFLVDLKRFGPPISTFLKTL